MIKVSNISKSFGNLKALENIDLHVKKGSIYGLVGSNGAGKTTLLKLLAGIYRKDCGEIRIDNEAVFENPKVKSKMVFMPDDLYSFEGYTIKEMAKFYKNIYKSFSDERFKKIQKAFNIDPNKKIRSLSKGMQRQVAFWLSLSIMPDIMILDEPVDGLDPVMRQKVKNLMIQDVAEREMTIIISSHNLKELENLCDHIGILHKGRMIVQNDLDDLKSNIHKIQMVCKKHLSKDVLSQMNILYKEERGSVQLLIVRGDKEKITCFLQRYEPVILDVLPLTLEEIFVYEMGDIGYEIENIIF